MAKKLQRNTSQNETSRRGSSARHEVLKKEILLTINALPFVTAWSNETGAAYRGGRLIHYGLKGSGDISGIIAPRGTRLEIEIKTGQAVQSKEQKAFEKMIISHGGLYILARSVGDAMIQINQWQALTKVK